MGQRKSSKTPLRFLESVSETDEMNQSVKNHVGYLKYDGIPKISFKSLGYLNLVGIPKLSWDT